MSKVDSVVQDFTSEISGEYSVIEEIEIETPEYGHSIRVTTEYTGDEEDFKEKILDLKAELEDRLENFLDKENFTKDRQVYIRIDW